MKLTLAQARRIAITAQGLAYRRPRGRGCPSSSRVLGNVGLLQIDSVNVLARSHYLPLFSAWPYPMALLDDYAYRRRGLFEYWGHVASLIPVEQWPLFVYRMEAFRENKTRGACSVSRPGLLESVLEEMVARGRSPAAGAEATAWSGPGDRGGTGATPSWPWSHNSLRAVSRLPTESTLSVDTTSPSG